MDKFDLDSVPVLSVSISAPRDLKEITYLADKLLKQNLETVADVGSINIVGSRTRAIQVAVDFDRLRAYGLTVQDVSDALQQQNIEVPGGRIEQGPRELVVRTLGRMSAVRDFNQLILANVGGQPIFLRDVASITDSIEEPRTLSRLNGQNSVTLVVRKQSGSNTIKVIESVKGRLTELRTILPPDFEVDIVRDQSQFIQRSMDEVSFHLMLGALLVAATVFFFLHDWRGTVVACVAIPASIIATFALMRVLNYTLNNSTMLGLVFAVGIVIDDAIVVLENIHRTMEEKGWDGMRAASYATREIALAVMATTLSLVVIFLPLAFMKGRTGMFFASYGVTVAFAILVSLFISFTLTPMLASRFLRHTEDPALREKKAQGGALMRWLADHYSRVLGWSLGHRWVIMVASLACVASLWWLVPLTRFTFLPLDDSSQFEVALVAPEGSSMERVADLCTQIEREVKSVEMEGKPAVIDTLVTLGPTSGRVGKGEGDVTQATLFCRLPELGGRFSQLMGKSRRWSQFTVMNEVRRRLLEYPDLRASVQTISPINSSGGRNSELSLNILGPDLDRLTEYSNRLMDQMRNEVGLVDVDSTLSNRKPELQVQIDRVKASQFGFDVQDIADTLRILVGGVIVGTYRENDDQYDVWLRARQGGRRTQESLETITLRAAGSGRPGSTTNVAARADLVQLGNFVHLSEQRGPNQIDRFQRQRKITVAANLGDAALGEAIDRVKAIVQDMNLPADYRVVFTGRAKQLRETLDNFLIAFLLAMVFMYMVLAAQFEHFIHPVAILLAVPLSLPFALLWMAFLQEQMNIYAIFGLFMLFGVVKKNGILQIDYTNTLRSQGMPREEAILLANRRRLRPILMTTMMLIASMIPIALGTGPGSAGRASMAKVIIGGQALCLLLTLLVTPVSYAIFDDWGRGRFWRRRQAAGPAGAQPEPAQPSEPGAPLRPAVR